MTKITSTPVILLPMTDVSEMAACRMNMRREDMSLTCRPSTGNSWSSTIGGLTGFRFRLTLMLSSNPHAQTQAVGFNGYAMSQYSKSV